MEIKKAIKIMKIVLLIVSILFLFTYTSFKTNDCGMCSFDEKGIDKFMNDYSIKCLTYETDNPDITKFYQQKEIPNK